MDEFCFAFEFAASVGRSLDRVVGFRRFNRQPLAGARDQI